MSRSPPINYGLFNHNNIIIPNELGSIGPYNQQYTKLFLVAPLVSGGFFKCRVHGWREKGGVLRWDTRLNTGSNEALGVGV